VNDVDGGADDAAALVVDRYELGPVIGLGGMGEIRRAHDRRLGRDVAIKFLRIDVAEGDAGRRRFEDEARAAGRLNHPNAVTVFDTGEHEGQAYFVMELLPGPTLADEIGEGPLAPERAREIGIAVLGALGVAHGLGIIHRDIKPANILLTAEGSPKLGDFGIAKSAESLHATSAGMVIGTPAYLAPERIQGQKATPRSDLYALGVVLYQALAGREPFTAEEPMGIAHTILNVEALPVDRVRPEVDPGLSAAIAKAMAKDPEQRFSSASEMAAALAGPAPEVAADDLDDERTVALAPATQVLPPVAPSAAPAARPAASNAAVAPVPATSRGRGGLVVAAVVAALVLVSLLTFLATRDDEPGSGARTTTGATLPPELDKALDRLEDEVNP